MPREAAVIAAGGVDDEVALGVAAAGAVGVVDGAPAHGWFGMWFVVVLGGRGGGDRGVRERAGRREAEGMERY